jgi:LacI family transcriptional regulator
MFSLTSGVVNEFLMATIQEIADAAGVSAMTVSRVLNTDVVYRRPTFATRASKIRNIAKQMGYRPNASAQAVRSGRFDSIALLLGSNPIFSMMPEGLMPGIQAEIDARDLHLVVGSLSDEVLTSEREVPKLLRRLTSDGLLVNYNANIPPEMVRLIHSYRLPSVWINSKHEADCVYPDDYGAGAAATRRLLELGHQKIVFVSFGNDTPPAHYSAVDRFEAYSQVMREAGLQPRRVGHPLVWDRGEIVSSMRELFQSADRPTAAIAYNDIDARATLVGAWRAGLEVPRDLSVITFHGGLLDDLGVKIDLYKLPEYEMGRIAVSMLIEKIASPERPLPPRLMPFTWLAGRSIGPAPLTSS